MAIPTPIETTPTAPRSAVFDGLRGVAIILVVLSHGWTIWPTTEIVRNSLVKAIFSSGDFAVSVFFVLGAFLATRALLRTSDSAIGLRPGVALVRRWIRLSGQTYVLLVVVLLVTALDTTDTYPETATRESAFRAMTYTWNWYARNNALVARPDLGHLWYLSVDMQMFVIILVLAWLLRRHRPWLIVALGVCMLALFAWRSHIYDVEGAYPALLRTWARGDAPLTGALAAAALPYLRVLADRGRQLIVVSVLALVPLLYFNAPPEGYFHAPGVLLDVALFAFVVGCTLAVPPRGVSVTLGARPLAFLGRHSLSIYLWHYPIFWFTSRHTQDWHWETRVLVAFAVTALAVVLSEWLVEGRVRRWLAAPGWRGTDRGFAPYLLDQARAFGMRERLRRVVRPRAAESYAPAVDATTDPDPDPRSATSTSTEATPSARGRTDGD